MENEPEIKMQMLKLKREFWEPVISGAKCFEVRNNDRDFKVGQMIMFRDPENDEVMEAQFIITYILKGWGIQEGHVVFAMHRLELPPLEDFQMMTAKEAGIIMQPSEENDDD